MNLLVLFSFQVQDNLGGSIKFHLYRILLEVCLKGKFKDDQQKITGASVLSLPVLAWSSKSIYLDTGFPFVIPGCTIRLVFYYVLSYLS